MEMPFMSPPSFDAGVSTTPGPADAAGDWFIFQGDRLLVEMGPPTPAPDDPRVASRPAWARLALQKRNIDHNWLGFTPTRTLYVGCLEGTHCWAVEAPPDAAALPAAFGPRVPNRPVHPADPRSSAGYVQARSRGVRVRSAAN